MVVGQQHQLLTRIFAGAHLPWGRRGWPGFGSFVGAAVNVVMSQP
jgi:hypothetical protein